MLLRFGRLGWSGLSLIVLNLSLSLSLANGGESKDAGVLKLRIGEYAGLKGEGGELFGLFLGLLSVWCLVGNGGMDYGDYY